jgi:hypothetical protein
MFKYKMRKLLQAFCEKCDTWIEGNGSIATPFWCICGLYEYDHDTRGYKLTPTL